MELAIALVGLAIGIVVGVVSWALPAIVVYLVLNKRIKRLEECD